ncbi:efflux RND transporter periplasmic adaptor subunit [Flavobacterium sp. I3-2]|uniref:efflux RND transporter periplasmic adaptor subunit n=1 Tax=Flavobacterium sp. I3-2 TaxID=2748319 RepID=UPI0015B2A67A|nr:efflux RND transporter periplasmic adaptor subunit [Flavobacterium sp. I3-2]
MKKYKTAIIVSIIIVVFAAIGIYLIDKNLNDKNKSTEVEVATLATGEIIQKVSATGKIQPEIEVKISSEVSGEIIDLPVKEGQLVTKGQLLVRINPDLYQSSIDRTVASLATSRAGLSQAEAQLKEAKLSYDRNKVLLDKGVISKAEWDKIVSAYEVAVASKNSSKFNVEAAQASVTEARDNMNRTTIYAPVAGTISRLDVELGERVLGTQQMTGTELMRVANLDNMEVEVDVNENDIVKIAVGNEAIIEVDAYLKKEFKGVVTSISNSSTSTTTTADQVTNFKVKVRILKESYQDLLEGKPVSYSPFRPGMTATVDIISKKLTNVTMVPISAIVMKTQAESVESTKVVEKVKDDKVTVTENVVVDTEEKKNEAVFVKNGDKAELRFVKTGIQDNKNIQILEGLKPGDQIIVGPYSVVSKTLKVGDKVSVKGEQVKK